MRPSPEWERNERRSTERQIDWREKSWQRRLKFTDECLAGKPGVDQPPLDTHRLRPDALVCDAHCTADATLVGVPCTHARSRNVQRDSLSREDWLMRLDVSSFLPRMRVAGRDFADDGGAKRKESNQPCWSDNIKVTASKLKWRRERNRGYTIEKLIRAAL